MSERLSLRRVTAPRLGVVPLVLRVTVLASSGMAILATVLPGWDVPNGYIYLAAIAAVVASVVPDSGAGFVFAAAIVVGWVTGAETASVEPAVVLTALALLVGHVAGALAAAMPPTAAADLTLTLRWWRSTAAIGAGVVATAGLVATLNAVEPRGSIVLVLAALILVGATAWWWSASNAES